MVPKLHAKRTHFRGTANYLLHDIGGKTKDRVAWTEVRNVASRNPDVAWRVMAATAMDQDRLKRQAGIKNTGRKSKDHVLHFSLAWHPEEAANLNRQEMLRAATTILKIMGAEDHQSLIVAHNDGHPHVHVLVNRVHPHDGRILSSSYEKLKASRWAEEYEKERGKIYCEQRVINNQARDRKEHTRGEKDKPRHIHDVANSSANDNDRKQQLLDDHRRQAFALKEAGRQQAARHAEAWSELETRYRETRKQLTTTTKQQILRSCTQIRDRFRPLWESQYHEQQAEQRVFEQRETSTLGRIQNALRSIDFGSLIGRQHPEDGRITTIGEAFQAIGNAGARVQALQRQQDIAKEALARQQKRDEQMARQAHRAALQKAIAAERLRFQAERSSLILTQAMENAKLKAQWLEKGRRLRQEWQQIRTHELSEPIHGKELTPVFEAAAKGRELTRTEQGSGDSPAPARPTTRTNSSELLPSSKTEEAARQIDQWQVMRAKRFGHDRESRRNRDDVRER